MNIVFKVIEGEKNSSQIKFLKRMHSARKTQWKTVVQYTHKSCDLACKDFILQKLFDSEGNFKDLNWNRLL